MRGRRWNICLATLRVWTGYKSKDADVNDRLGAGDDLNGWEGKASSVGPREVWTYDH